MNIKIKDGLSRPKGFTLLRLCKALSRFSVHPSTHVVATSWMELQFLQPRIRIATRDSFELNDAERFGDKFEMLTAQPASMSTARVEGWLASTAMCTGVDPPGPFKDCSNIKRAGMRVNE